jgi:phage gp36-like protein
MPGQLHTLFHDALNMPYTTPLNLLNKFGDTEIALIAASDKPNVTAVLLRLTVTAGDRSAYSAQDIADADQALVKIQNAIASAERMVDSYIAPRYTLPLEQTFIDQSSLPEFCNDMVRYKLMDDRTTDEVDKRYTEATRWLRDVSQNRASLGAQDTAVATPAGHMTTRTGNSAHAWDEY